MTRIDDTVSFVVSAEADGQVFDLWRLVRREREFRTIVHEHDELNRTYKDGEKPYLKGRHGLEKWLQPSLYRGMESQTKARDKHFRQGWPSHWKDISDVQSMTGTTVILYEDLPRFPVASLRPSDIVVPISRSEPVFTPKGEVGPKPVYRATIPLRTGIGVTGHVYLTRSTSEARAELRSLARSAACLWVWTAWEFWSAAYLDVGRIRRRG